MPDAGHIHLVRGTIAWLTAWGLIACATPRPWLSASDPAGDDHGPGTYRYPAHRLFPPGSFDLRGLRLAHTPTGWLLQVEFDKPVHTETVSFGPDRRQTIFPQVVDVYLRFDPAQQEETRALPGRAVAFQAGSGWQRAVVLSATPQITRQGLHGPPGGTGQVIVPAGVRVLGRRLIVMIAHDFFPGRPTRAAVLVAGLGMPVSFRVQDRLRAQPAPEDLILPVLRDPGPCHLEDPAGPGCHFSGCSPCGHHPQVIDILAPAGAQEPWLSGYQPETGQPTRISMVPLSAHTPAAVDVTAPERE
jgi:hypothetical protein